MGCKKRLNTAELFSLQVKILRTTPVFLGTIKNFYLYGEHEGDTFATGGIKHFLLLCKLPYFFLYRIGFFYPYRYVTFDLNVISTYFSFFPNNLEGSMKF